MEVFLLYFSSCSVHFLPQQKPDDQTISLGWQGEEPRFFVSKGVRFCCESVGNYVSLVMCSTEDWQCSVQGEPRKISAFQECLCSVGKE